LLPENKLVKIGFLTPPIEYTEENHAKPEDTYKKPEIQDHKSPKFEDVQKC
jgi:hypothetical protein